MVDPELRVRGLEALRVIDTSVFPFITAGNTQAPTMALGWLAAEMIRGGARSSPSGEVAARRALSEWDRHPGR